MPYDSGSSWHRAADRILASQHRRHEQLRGAIGGDAASAHASMNQLLIPAAVGIAADAVGRALGVKRPTVEELYPERPAKQMRISIPQSLVEPVAYVAGRAMIPWRGPRARPFGGRSRLGRRRRAAGAPIRAVYGRRDRGPVGVRRASRDARRNARDFRRSKSRGGGFGGASYLKKLGRLYL